MFHVQPIYQNDPRWQETLLGFSEDSTIGKFGCLLTSITMVVNGFGGDETPASFNEKMKGVAGFKSSSIVPGLVSKVHPGVTFVKRIKSPEAPAPLGEIDAALAAGMPVIVKVDYSPADGVQDHWMVIYDKQDGDYLIHDPFPKRGETPPISLTERYGFSGGPAEIIKDAIWYGGALPVPVTPPVEPPKDGETPVKGPDVFVTADSLALRRQPVMIPSTVIKRVKLGAKLTSLEDESATRQKTGQMNQWLHVQDETGTQGYVAAWFVTATQTGVPVIPVQPPTPPTPPVKRWVVYAAEDRLSLRSQPKAETRTFIKRLPLNAELAVLEPEADARRKIGQQDNWLQVQDVEGAKGYVAAWFLSPEKIEPPVDVTPKPPGGSTPETPTEPELPPAPPEKNLVLRPTDSGLALRSQPVISASTLIKRLPLAADLLVIEPKVQAEKKIGVANQWIKVRDIQGAEGYVAAWYVVKRPAAAP